MDEKKPGSFEAEDFLADASFQNYCLNKNEEDTKLWKQWLMDNPEKQAMADEAKKMLDILFLRLPASEYQQELERIKTMLAGTASIKKEIPSLVRFLKWDKSTFAKRIKRKKGIAFLAVTVTLLLATAGYFFLQHPSSQDADLTERHNSGNSPIQFILDDSTAVTLAPNSRLRFKKLFGEIDRKVYLDGEAAFHVKRDEKHPFKVYEDGLVATVLGTVFNVKAAPEKSAVIVELLEGKLKLEAENSTDSIVLAPNERAVYIRNGRSIYKETFSPSFNKKFPGKADKIVFRKDNFEAVAVKMKTVFGIILLNRSNKNNWSFTGEFTDISAEEIIENICLIEHLDYEMKGDTIIIK
jgi:transmembrane sensor